MNKVFLLLASAVWFLFAVCFSDGAQAIESPKGPVSMDGYLYSRFFPAAIRADGADETALEVVTGGGVVKEVSVFWGSHNPTWLRLYDDASHGDRIRGDGIFSLNHLTYSLSNVRAFYETDMADLGVHVRLIYTTGDTVQQSERLGLVDRSLSYPFTRLGKGCHATRSTFFITDSTHDIFPGYPVTFIECGVSVFPAAYQKLYTYFPDVFDFLVVMPATRLVEPDAYVERVPYCVMARNEVKNIGVPVFDESAKYHSAGRLRSVVYHSFGMPAILEHELGHTWGMRLGIQAGIVDGLVGVNERYGHWVAETDINGQMNQFVNGCTLPYNGDGTWRLKPQDPNNFPYSPLELYVMGLIPSSDVPPVHLLKKINSTDPMKVTAESVSTWNIAGLVALAGGERIPSVATSQKNFSAAFIVVSDRSFSSAEMAYFSAMADYFASDAPGTAFTMPFETATGKRATLDATLPGMELLGLAESPAEVSRPMGFALSSNYPNPFNPSTEIQFHLQAFAQVTLTIYNVRGESVRRLLDGWFGPGNHVVSWDGLNEARQAVAGGVYMYVAKTRDVRVSKKMVLLR